MPLARRVLRQPRGDGSAKRLSVFCGATCRFVALRVTLMRRRATSLLPGAFYLDLRIGTANGDHRLLLGPGTPSRLEEGHAAAIEMNATLRPLVWNGPRTTKFNIVQKARHGLRLVCRANYFGRGRRRTSLFRANVECRCRSCGYSRGQQIALSAPATTLIICRPSEPAECPVILGINIWLLMQNEI